MEIQIYVNRKNTKNLIAKAKPDGIHVTAAPNVSDMIIQKFLKDRWELLQASYLEQVKVEKYRTKVLSPSSRIYFWGKKTTIAELNISGDNINEKLQKLLQLELNKKIEFYSAKHFWKFEKYQIPDVNQITIRKMKTRWGVCNFRTKRITLNLDLVKLPPEYLEYILIHEWTHLVHPNHSPTYWKFVEMLHPDYKYYDRGLKKWQKKINQEVE